LSVKKRDNLLLAFEKQRLFRNYSVPFWKRGGNAVKLSIQVE